MALYHTVNGSPVAVNNILIGGAETQETVTGNNTLSLPDAKVNSLTSVVLDGATEQSGTPTPNNPVDIVCNNGAIKVSPNLVKFNETRIDSSTWDNADKTKGFEVYADVYSKSVGASMLTNANAFGVFVPCKQGESISLNFFDYTPYQTRSLYCEITADRKCNTTPQTYENAGVITQKTFTLTKSDSIGFIFEWYINSQQTRNYTASNYMIVKGSTPPTIYMPYGKIYTDGTTETVTDSLSNTATAEMLLKVGTYKDTQSVLNGAVTRNVGVLVLDGVTAGKKIGTAWNSTYKRGSFAVSDMASTTASVSDALCSHFAYSASVYLAPTEAGVCTNNGTIFISFLGLDNVTSADTANAWLADKYNAGQPVIIIYPLATATTETVTAQTLTVQQGTNTLTATGSISTLGLSATYTKGTQLKPDYVIRNGKLVWAKPNMYLTGPNNYTVVGSPTITDGVVTDLLNRTNYIQLPAFPAVVNAFEMVLKVKGSGQYRSVVYNSRSGSSVFYRAKTQIARSGEAVSKWVFKPCSSSTEEAEYSVSLNGGIPYTPNEWVYVKHTMASNGDDTYTYTLSYSLDGTTYTDVASKTSSYGISGTDWGGMYICSDQNFSANDSITINSLDLKESYIKIDGSLWFYGKNYATQNIAPVPSGYTYGNTTTSAIGYVDMRTQAFTAAPTGATIGRDS